VGVSFLEFRTVNNNVMCNPACRLIATCPTGFTASGGGYRFFTGTRADENRAFPIIQGLFVDVQSSFATAGASGNFSNPTQWRVEASVDNQANTDPVTLTAFVYCIRTASP